MAGSESPDDVDDDDERGLLDATMHSSAYHHVVDGTLLYSNYSVTFP